MADNQFIVILCPVVNEPVCIWSKSPVPYIKYPVAEMSVVNVIFAELIDNVVATISLGEFILMRVMPVVVILPALSVPVMMKVFTHPVSASILLREAVHDILLPFISSDTGLSSLNIPVSVTVAQVN